jgi:fructosamine-3-kinase
MRRVADALDPILADRIEAALGVRPVAAEPLPGGSTVAVLKVDLADGSRIVAKAGQGALALEAWMLGELARHSALPLPAVLHAADDLLLLEHVDHEPGPPSHAAQLHAAELLAAMHAVPWPAFGYARDTSIGRLPQPNPPVDRWVPFFRDHRLLHMARAGHAEGTVDAELLRRLEVLAGRLEDLLSEPRHPALLHGDIWTGNLLHRDGRIAAFIDPAISCGHPEMELAYPTLFGTFDEAFFRRYAEVASLDPGFWDGRRPIYLLYPLLVHVRYWDPAYAEPIRRILDRYGA